MADYYAIITQKGYSLEVSDVNLPHQFSSNIPIKIIKDTQTFSNYDLLPFFVHSTRQYIDAVRANEGILMEYDEVSRIAILPYSAFNKKGYLFISLAMKEKNGDKVLYTGSARFDIKESINGEDTIPVESVWIDAITKYVDTYMNEKYKPTYDALLENAEDLQGQAESLHNTVTQQQQNINNTLQTTQGLQENIEEINETTEQLQQTTTQLQNNVNLTVQKATQQQEQIDNAIDVMGDYEIVQDNPTQIRFKKGDGTYGDTVNLGDNLASKSMVNAGYDTYSGNSYSGSASDYGIEIGKASGAYEQEGTPTPESPVEPKFFEPKHINTNGGNLFDASKIPNKTHGGATVTNHHDGSFTISGNGNITTGNYDLRMDLTHEETIKLLKAGTLKCNFEIVSEPYFYILIVNKNGVIKEINGVTTGLKTLDITQEYLNDDSFYLRYGFYGILNKPIKSGTIKPMVYQDGDGAWLPYNADSTPLDITLRALPNGVCDTYENRVITRRVGVYIADTIDTLKTEVTSGRKYAVLEPENKKYQDGMTSFLCNKIQKTVSYTRDDCIYQNASNFVIVGTADDTLETFKERFLNTIVYYELVEPTTEQVDLPVIPSYYPFTNAWHDSKVEASELTWNILARQYGTGQTTVKKDEAVLTELDLNTERTATPTTVKVQLKDTSGNTFYVETSPECVYLKGTDGSEITQKSLNDKIGQLINLVAFYSASPVSVLTDLKKYITTIS